MFKTGDKVKFNHPHIQDLVCDGTLLYKCSRTIWVIEWRLNNYHYTIDEQDIIVSPTYTNNVNDVAELGYN